MQEDDKPRPMTLEDWHRIQGNMQTAQQRREEALIEAAKGLNVDRSDWQTLYPLRRESDMPDEWGKLATYLSIPVTELPVMAQAYIDMVETERTNRLCKCEWIVHPDDVNKPHGTRRVHKGQEATDCPVHTKLGFLLYFFVHYFKSDCPACPPDCKSCLFNPDCECYEHQLGEHYESERHPLKCVCGNDWICPEAHFYQPELPEDEPTLDVTAKAHGD